MSGFQLINPEARHSANPEARHSAGCPWEERILKSDYSTHAMSSEAIKDTPSLKNILNVAPNKIVFQGR
jgi:hypothetical protein